MTFHSITSKTNTGMPVTSCNQDTQKGYFPSSIKLATVQNLKKKKNILMHQNLEQARHYKEIISFNWFNEALNWCCRTRWRIKWRVYL